jgi:hypothetical protein
MTQKSLKLCIFKRKKKVRTSIFGMIKLHAVRHGARAHLCTSKGLTVRHRARAYRLKMGTPTVRMRSPQNIVITKARWSRVHGHFTGFYSLETSSFSATGFSEEMKLVF